MKLMLLVHLHNVLYVHMFVRHEEEHVDDRTDDDEDDADKLSL